jgi:hypothetical protein
MLFKVVNTYKGQVLIRFAGTENDACQVSIEVGLASLRSGPYAEPILFADLRTFQDINAASAFIVGYGKAQALEFLARKQREAQPAQLSCWTILDRLRAELIARRELMMRHRKP